MPPFGRRVFEFVSFRSRPAQPSFRDRTMDPLALPDGDGALPPPAPGVGDGGRPAALAAAMSSSASSTLIPPHANACA